MKKISLFILLAPILSCDFQDDPTIPPSEWEYAQPGEVGVQEEPLFNLDEKLKDGIYGQINSLVIIKDDNLIYESYYNNTDRNALVQTFGISVSVASILAGIALDQGILPELNTPIQEVLSGNQSAFEDPLRAQITLRHLVEMRTGIAWNEFLRPFNDPQNTANQMQFSPDWSTFTLNEPMEAVPGGRFAYSSGAIMVLSKIIQEQSGMSLEEFAVQNLLEPLGISEYNWSSDPSGVTNAAWGLDMTTISMAKIGYLVLNRGRWFSNRVLPGDYIEEMTSLQSQFNFNNDFGLSWWRFSDFNFFVQNLEVNDISFAWGAGGQFIFVVPQYNLVVATSASNFGPQVNAQIAFNMLFEDIIPAIDTSL